MNPKIFLVKLIICPIVTSEVAAILFSISFCLDKLINLIFSFLDNSYLMNILVGFITSSQIFVFRKIVLSSNYS